MTESSRVIMLSSFNTYLITDFPYLITATFSKPKICPKQRIKENFAFSFGGWDKSRNIFWDFVDFTTRCIYLMNDLHLNLNLQLDWPKDEVQQLRTTVVMQIFSYLCAFLTNYADLVYSTKNFREEDPCQQKTWKDEKKKNYRIIRILCLKLPVLTIVCTLGFTFCSRIWGDSHMMSDF